MEHKRGKITAVRIGVGAISRPLNYRRPRRAASGLFGRRLLWVPRSAGSTYARFFFLACLRRFTSPRELGLRPPAAFEGLAFNGEKTKTTMDRYIATRSFADFDIIHSPGEDLAFTKVREAISDNIQAKKLSISSPTSPIQMIEHYHVHSISISMPASPSAFDRERSKGIFESEKGGSDITNGKINHPISATGGLQQQNQSKFHSQPMPIGNSHSNTSPDIKILDSPECQQQISWNSRIKDERYDSFKTWSGKLGRQISNLRGKPQEPEEVTDAKNAKPEAVPAVGRYFDALEGPELDKLKVPFM
ncbi:hypothetical protein BHE74_00000819 [Ensete ventricosum]|nr:hypothetical protein GW17_00001474 [Ensete ventricosum]RWW90042.1 hypothetical protein BHE74_00000819 [Ensete ventricosum]RZR83900.1 hypothetical protein BHM03_00010609 [Ensete ventricosum]